MQDQKSLMLLLQTSLAAKGALAHSNSLQNPKWPLGGPKMVDGVRKSVNPQDFGRSKQLSLNKFFDPSTPSMRKGRNGEKKMEKNDVYSGH